MSKGYVVTLSKRAQKDLAELKRSHLGDKAENILKLLSEDPFRSPSPFGKLSGEMKGWYSRRLNSTHRVLYLVEPSEDPEHEGMVSVARMRTHYSGYIPSFFM
ncbi:MAG: Txe/YoeB family addiction module toxin [Methanomassiliicoccaceae archaeon]|nr:Txe/YoeB family addiction module toxin [Methanomassiliicoccaceae archaeon]